MPEEGRRGAMLKDNLKSARHFLTSTDDDQSGEGCAACLLDYLEALHPIVLRSAYRQVCQEIDTAQALGTVGAGKVTDLMVERDNLLAELLYA